MENDYLHILRSLMAHVCNKNKSKLRNSLKKTWLALSQNPTLPYL